MPTDSTPSISLPLLRGRPLSEQVYEQLKRAILQGHLEPETRLTETDMAGQIGVSPTPVREAFRRLAAEGFLEILPWRGAKVRGISSQEILETYQCREVLEGLACRLAAASIDDNGLEKLRRLVEESRSPQSPADIVSRNSAIHDLILTYAGNAKLTATLALFQETILRDRTLTAYNENRQHSIHAEHEAILAALKQRDASAAEEAMRVHVRNGYAYRRRVLQGIS